MLDVLGFIIFGIGTFICGLNFYLSFLCYPVHRIMGWEYKSVSGIPLFGSLLLIVSVVLFRDSPVLFWSGIIITLFDTGGLPWFAGMIVWMYLFRRDKM